MMQLRAWCRLWRASFPIGQKNVPTVSSRIRFGVDLDTWPKRNACALMGGVQVTYSAVVIGHPSLGRFTNLGECVRIPICWNPL